MKALLCHYPFLTLSLWHWHHGWENPPPKHDANLFLPELGEEGDVGATRLRLQDSTFSGRLFYEAPQGIYLYESERLHDGERRLCCEYARFSLIL